jgi:hypothetical protein
VRAHGAGESKRGEGGAAPEEGLARGEGEREREVASGKRKGMPLFFFLWLVGGEREAAARGRRVRLRDSGFRGFCEFRRRRGCGEEGRGRWHRRSEEATAARRHRGSGGGEARGEWKTHWVKLTAKAESREHTSPRLKVPFDASGG